MPEPTMKTVWKGHIGPLSALSIPVANFQRSAGPTRKKEGRMQDKKSPAGAGPSR